MATRRKPSCQPLERRQSWRALFSAWLALLCCCPVFAHADDLSDQAIWHDQRALTADFSFSAQLETDGDERYAVQAIRIINRKSGTVFQEIRGIGAMGTWGKPNDMVRVVDANFDGHPDLAIPFADGGAGPNFSNNYYLFDPAAGAFRLNQELSDLPQPSINLDGTISSASRGGCCQHHAETYRFHQGKLQLVADWDEASTADGKWIVTTTGKLLHGKWRTKVKKTPLRID